MTKTDKTVEAVERLNYIAQRLGEDTFTELLRYYPQATSDDRLRAFAYDFRKALSELTHLQAERDRAVEIIDWAREELHQRRVADWFPEGAHNAAEQMSEDMRLIGNRLADLDFATLPPPVKEAEPPALLAAAREDRPPQEGAEPVAWMYVENRSPGGREVRRVRLSESRQAISEADINEYEIVETPLFTTPPDTQARIEALEGVIENLLAHTEGVQLPTTAHIMRARAKAALHPKEGAEHGG